MQMGSGSAAPSAAKIASVPDAVAAELAHVVAALPGGGERRPGQEQMASAVRDAIAAGRHLVVQAGTGTGKTVAYLVPAVLSGKRVVVATATKALQDQLATKDLPFLQAHLGRPFTWAVLKGRSNYVCVQRMAEHASGDAQLGLDGVAERVPAEDLAMIALWASTTEVGDRAELEVEPSERAWSAVSTTARDCPGASKCPRGAQCFAERARSAASEADVIVVNLHLYGVHLATQGGVLPEHDLVIVDEAHQLEDVLSATCGVEITGGRFTNLARVVRGIVVDDKLVGDVDAGSNIVADALRPHRGDRIRDTLPGDVARALTLGRSRADRAIAALRAVPDSNDDVTARRSRAMRAATALVDDIDAVDPASTSNVVWVEGTDVTPVLRVAPIDVASMLRVELWDQRPGILTSATIAPGYARRTGLPEADTDILDVGSPFDYETNALLYCARHLPDPRSPEHRDAVVDELAFLIEAAAGRTLALFTSWRAMEHATALLRQRLDEEILCQGQLPKPRLLERFANEPETCLFATMSFWQGVDVPGASLSLVAIDRLPFPRPDEPLLQARRERAGAGAFEVVDVPRAATMLAQGAGRLIRTATDRGVVAVLDPRLSTARYGWTIVNSLPPMRRTKDRDEVAAFLASLR
jgi:ATP-dependent DNA helicase DinG